MRPFLSFLPSCQCVHKLNIFTILEPKIYYLQTKSAVPSLNRRVLEGMGTFAILAADAKVLGCVFETPLMVSSLVAMSTSVHKNIHKKEVYLGTCPLFC
jgi:hypothetical protein